MLDGHLPLTEVSKWDLQDVRKYNALLDMREAYRTASAEYEARKAEEEIRRHGH